MANLGILRVMVDRGMHMYFEKQQLFRQNSITFGGHKTQDILDMLDYIGTTVWTV